MLLRFDVVGTRSILAVSQKTPDLMAEFRKAAISGKRQVVSVASLIGVGFVSGHDISLAVRLLSCRLERTDENTF